MSERDKMLRGEPYDAGDPSLVAARIRARQLAQRLDALDPADVAAQRSLLHQLLGSIGADSTVVSPFRCDYGSNVSFGSRVFINFGCVILDAAPVILEDDVQLGPLVQLLTSDHPRDAAERAAGIEYARPIIIGARSWLGGGVIVLPGVEIGPDVIVGAGSVVTRSLPAGVTAVGNPCRPVSTGEPTGLRLGEGELPPGLDRVNFGAFLLAFLWAPLHRLWGWFGVFVALEALESLMGLGAPGLLGGLFEQPVMMVGFRIVYWTVTVAFALRANRLVWAEEGRRSARATGQPALRRPPLVSTYLSNQRVWSLAGLILLAGMPLTLLIGPVNRISGAVADVAVTAGSQAVLLAALYVYDRLRTHR